MDDLINSTMEQGLMTSRISSFFIAALAVGLMSLLAMPAHAAVIDFSPLSSLANQFLQSFVELLVAVMVGAAAWAAKRWFGLQVDAKQREALHGAIERGIGSALEALLKKTEGNSKFEVDSEMVALVANYVVKMSPDAVKYFGLDPDKLADLIKAKFGDRMVFDFGEIAATVEPGA